MFPKVSRGNALLVAAAVLLALGKAGPVRAQSLAPMREYQPFVLKGAALADWVGVVDIDSIGLYTYAGGGQFIPIPFQIDKRRKINLRCNLNQPGGTLGDVDVCEFGYFRETVVEPCLTDVFASNVLEASDEIVFLLNDVAGAALSAPTTDWHPSVSTNNRYRLILRDPRTGAYRYVYAYEWSGSVGDRNLTDYVHYEQDTPTPACDPGPASCGQAQSFAAALPSLTTYRVHFQKNWVTDAFEVKPADTDVPNLDMLFRFEYSVPNETEDSWSRLGAPRFLGVKDGQIRVIRGVQGAQSGVHTTKYEFVYGTQLHTVGNVRVHPLTELRARVDNDPTIPLLDTGFEAFVWSESKKASDNTYLDKIDRTCPSGYSCPLHGSGVGDWTEVDSERRGTYVHALVSDRPLVATSATYTYTDSQTNTGEHGRKWVDIGNTQDGIDNDGGCGVGSDPESPDLHFARATQILTPQPVRVDGSDPAAQSAEDIAANEAQPVTATFKKECRGCIPIPQPPPPLCPPELVPVNDGMGAAHLSLTNNCTTPVIGLSVYRALVGSTSWQLVASVPVSQATYVDHSVRRNQGYSYKAATFDEWNQPGTFSTISSLTITDTTAPGPPGAVSCTPGSGNATCIWSEVFASDIHQYKIGMSQTSGGPYTTIATIGAPAPRVAIAPGLNNNQTYYFVVQSVDTSNNVGAASTEVAVTPN